MESATQVSGSEDVRTGWNTDAEFIENSKKDSLCLDNHLMASVITGLIEEYHGASNYLNHLPNPKEATVTIVCRSKSREEQLNLEILTNQSVPHLLLHGNPEKQEFEATHIITGIFYGAEVYCVMSLELDGGGEDEKERKEAVDELSKIGNEFSSTISEFDDFEYYFKMMYHTPERHLLTSIKCRLDSDLQSEPFLQCDIFEAGKHCVDLNMQMQETGKAKAVPIAVQLCPLKFLLNPDRRWNKICNYRDVDSNLVTRWCRIFSDLKRAVIRAELISNAHKESTLCNFVTTIFAYQDYLKTNLKDSLLKFRSFQCNDYEIAKITNQAESHPHFNNSQLDQWLELKQAELDMLDLMTSKIATGITFLADGKQLQTFLTETPTK